MIELRTLGGLDLRGSDGHAIYSVLAHPKRVALLLYLAVEAPDGGHRRDRILPLLWPEADQEHARASLRKAIHFLRQSLGADAIESRGDEEIALDGKSVACDAARFRTALAEGRVGAAMELYRGELCPGFFVPDAPEFERWLDLQRESLRRDAAAAAGTLAAAAEAAGDGEAAVAWATRTLELARDDEIPLRRLVSLLDRLGDRVAALRAYADYERRLAADGLAPSGETLALVDEIRTGTEPHEAPVRADEGRAGDARPAAEARARREEVTAGRAPAAYAGSSREEARGGPIVTLPSVESAARLPARPRRWSGVGLAAAIGAAVAGVALGRSAMGDGGSGEDPARLPIVSVGAIQDHTEGDSTLLAPALVDILGTNLARVPGLRVVSGARLYEFLVSERSATEPGAIARAARRAGATEIVDGALYRLPDGDLRFDLRRVELESGQVRAAYSVVGPDVFALADRATAQLATDMRLAAGGPSVAEVTTRSLPAYRLYLEGLRAFHLRADARGAFDLFAAALREDSTFAMAAYWAWRVAEAAGRPGPEWRGLGERAARLADGASDRERLLIRSMWLAAVNDPGRVAVAETLATRYPTEAEGHLLLGQHLLAAGEFGGAISQLGHVIALDSTLARDAPRCRACEAYASLVVAYMHADSLDAAERTAGAFVRYRRDSPHAWHGLADVHERQERIGEAAAARRRAVRLAPTGPEVLAIHDALGAMREGDFERADGLLAPRGDEPPEVLRELRWYRAIGLRNQGRLQEALSLALEYRASMEAEGGSSFGWFGGAMHAQALFESGRYREAASLFDSVRTVPEPPSDRGHWARHLSWYLTHSATARAAAGDTARLLAIADSLESIGPLSSYGRDRLLHHHVRGLLWLARGDTIAAERAFRGAIFSPTFGYTRTNLELGRLLLATGRPEEAVGILRAALHGSLEASNYYVTYTELHALLARAHEAADAPDSAAAHFAWVARALETSEPRFHALREEARARAARAAP